VISQFCVRLDASGQSVALQRRDLVIVDLTLGGEHGLELIQLLKNALPVPPALVFPIHDKRVCC